MSADYPVRLALLAVFALASSATFAAPEDVALLMGYAGNWRGGGDLSGAEQGAITCRMVLRPSGERLSFDGRCSLNGESQSFEGMLSYNDAAARYESRSPAGTFLGYETGNGVVFSVQDVNDFGQFNSLLSLEDGRITVDFRIVDAQSGGVTTTTVIFSRS
jgi:hypothetical protein